MICRHTNVDILVGANVHISPLQRRPPSGHEYISHVVRRQQKLFPLSALLRPHQVPKRRHNGKVQKSLISTVLPQPVVLQHVFRQLWAAPVFMV
jgi:hypothetical protein